MEDPIGRWLIEIVLLVFCALLACAQAALTNANESKLRAASEEDGRFKKLLPLLERPDPAIVSLRGLRTLFLLLIPVLGLNLIPGDMGMELKGLIFCLVAAPVLMILCKLVPEKLGRKRADKVLPALFSLIRLVNFIMTPLTALERLALRGLVRLFGIDPQAREEEVTEEEIRAMVDIGEESGVIESEERDMIKNVFEFGDLTAADCMTHRTDVTAICLEDDTEAILSTIRETGLSRFPVYGENIDDIVGILATREYLLNLSAPDPRPMADLIREAYFVPETVKTDVLLRNMQIAKTHIAIVVDEYGGMSGLVTMEDLLEEIVGNIYDEFDPADENDIQPLGDDCWRVSGSADLEALAEAMDTKLPEEYDTLGGLIFSRFTTIPEDGATPALTIPCTLDGEEPEEEDDEPADHLEVKVEKLEEHRVEWAHVRLIRAKKEEDEKED
ncbi:MAG: HlyC/CorC family transporter [Clostridiales bacterium]|nr:HlyC/CorC family transporter [Clostridiales bacterium]